MVPGGECLLVASSFEQARIAFEHVVRFMGSKLDDKSEWLDVGHRATGEG